MKTEQSEFSENPARRCSLQRALSPAEVLLKREVAKGEVLKTH